MPERTCFTCKHRLLCFLRRRIDDALTNAGNMYNIDGDEAPKGYLDIFDTLAKMCLHYNFKKEE